MTATASLAGLASGSPERLPVSGGGRVTACDGTVIEAEGLAGAPGGRVLIGARGVPAEIIGFRDGQAQLMGLDRLPRIVPGTMVRLVEPVRSAASARRCAAASSTVMARPSMLVPGSQPCPGVRSTLCRSTPCAAPASPTR